jgi:hypothetical protein
MSEQFGYCLWGPIDFSALFLGSLKWKILVRCLYWVLITPKNFNFTPFGVIYPVRQLLDYCFLPREKDTIQNVSDSMSGANMALSTMKQWLNNEFFLFSWAIWFRTLRVRSTMHSIICYATTCLYEFNFHTVTKKVKHIMKIQLLIWKVKLPLCQRTRPQRHIDVVKVK